MQSLRTMIAERRPGAGPAIRAAVVAGFALAICGCNTDQRVAAVPETPPDYRMRHPITISEADRTFEVFIGSNRGELNPSQRAEVLAFAQSWRRESTGGVIVDVPVGTSNERAAGEAMREIRSILNASGVPAGGVVVRGYHPPDCRSGRPVRPVARRYRTEPQQRLFRKPAVLESRLLQPTQSRRDGG
jgi:pilus assembly protein CpaD